MYSDTVYHVHGHIHRDIHLSLFVVCSIWNEFAVFTMYIIHTFATRHAQNWLKSLIASWWTTLIQVVSLKKGLGTSHWTNKRMDTFHKKRLFSSRVPLLKYHWTRQRCAYASYCKRCSLFFLFLSTFDSTSWFGALVGRGPPCASRSLKTRGSTGWAACPLWFVPLQS